MKKDADKTLKDMGLDMSSGIKLFLHQVVLKRALPFVVRTANGFTPEQEKRMVKETEYALKYGKSFKTVKEAFDDILKN
jgi:addiction module RelB/DinJ family antitoxin